MGQLLLVLLAVSLVGCSDIARSIDPGDQYSRAWKPTAACDERAVVDCDGAEFTDCGRFCHMRDSCVTYRDCLFPQPLRIHGQWMNVLQIEDSDWTRSEDYVSEIREQAPHHVRIEGGAVLVDDGRTPVYVGPGVTFLEVDGLSVEGRSRSVAVYIGAEASRITLTRVRIDGSRADRGALAIDAADYVTVTDSELWGDVELYRNCGEDGITRQTTPSNATFRRVQSDGTLRISARDGGKAYCLLDDLGSGIGSAGSNLDHARWTTVDDCDFAEGVHEGHSADGTVIK